MHRIICQHRHQCTKDRKKTEEVKNILRHIN
jgi:hypothetical protein